MQTTGVPEAQGGEGDRNGLGMVLAICAFALFGFAQAERTGAFPKLWQPEGCVTAAELQAADGLVQARSKGAFIRVMPSAVQSGGVDPRRGGQMVVGIAVEVVKAGCPTVRANAKYDAAFEMADGVPKITRMAARTGGVSQTVGALELGK